MSFAASTIGVSRVTVMTLRTQNLPIPVSMDVLSFPIADATPREYRTAIAWRV
jgi:hypothetical protein